MGDERLPKLSEGVISGFVFGRVSWIVGGDELIVVLLRLDDARLVV
jgi:hypothetical protein